jgi:ubiquitin carboxyl-terminal hydrolase 5/13
VGFRSHVCRRIYKYILSSLQRNSLHQPNPADALKFSVEDRMECSASGKVKYTYRDDWCLPLQIPLHLATNIGEVKEYEAKLAKAEQEGTKL